MMAFQFIFSRGNIETKGGWERQSCCFRSKIPWWKRNCETLRCQHVTASSFVANVRGEVFAHFHAVAFKRHIRLRNWLLGLPERILFFNNPFTLNKIMSMLLTLLFTCLTFAVSLRSDFLCTAHAYLNYAMVSVVLFSEICTKLYAVPLSEASRNRIRPDTRLQIKGRKNQHVLPAIWKFVHWLARYVSNIIYCCITLLQLMYRWQHQSRKLWIPPRMLRICLEGFSECIRLIRIVYTSDCFTVLNVTSFHGVCFIVLNVTSFHGVYTICSRKIKLLLWLKRYGNPCLRNVILSY
jgi:hypothetical protein